MSAIRCCIPQCSQNEDSHKTLHSFPNPKKDIERFRAWVHVIGGEILSLNNEDIYKRRKVCDAHFEERYRCRNNRISNIAMPTLFMPALPMSKLTKEKSLKENEDLLSKSISISALPMSELTKEESLKENEDLLSKSISISESINNNNDNGKEIQYMDHTYCLIEAAENPLETDKNEMDMDAPLPSPTEHLDLPSASVDEFMEAPITDLTVHCTSPIKKEPSKYEILQRKYKNLRRRFNNQLRAKKALKFTKEKSFFNLTKHMNPLARQFFWAQVQQSSKKSKGRRFSEEDKLLAMAIMQQSQKCYRFLQNIFILPSDYTLSKSAKSNTGEINGELLETEEKEI